MLLSTHKFGELDHYHTDISIGMVTDQKPAHAVAEGESTDLKLFSLAKLKTAPGDIAVNNCNTSIYLLESLGEWEQVDTHHYQ